MIVKITNQKLTKSDLPEFQRWLKQNGWTVGNPTGNFVVLRAKKDKQSVTLYGSSNREQLLWTKIHNEIVSEFLSR